MATAFVRACYSRAAVRECADAVKREAWTVRRRIDHKAKCIEVRKLFELCRERTGCCLFDYEYSPCQDYLRLAYQKGATKKAMDAQLRVCRHFLENELRGIAEMMASGEVDAVA